MENLHINTNGFFVNCRSTRCSYQTSLDSSQFDFVVGTNLLYGDIDSGGWSLSYALSMYNYDNYDIELKINIDGISTTVEDLQKITCYLDALYFETLNQTSVDEIVARNIELHNISVSSEDIRKMFHITESRFQRPLSASGNERFRCMAAIAYSMNKKIYCFPWLSKKMVEYYSVYLKDLCGVLTAMGMVVLLPTNCKIFPEVSKIIDMER